MSILTEAQIRLQEERRRRIEEERRLLREETQRKEISEIVLRARSTIDYLKQGGFERFIRVQTEQLQSNLAQLTELALTNLEQAVKLSREVSDITNRLPQTARHERAVIEDQERIDKEEQWANVFNWENKRSRNLVLNELTALYNESQSRYFLPEDLEQRLAELKQRAEAELAQREAAFAQKIAEESAELEKSKLIKTIEQADIPAEDVKKLTEKVKASSVEDLTKVVEETTEEFNQVQDREAIRREIVKMVYRSLKDASFIVDKPIKLSSEGDDIVLVRAKRPNGNQAKFKIKLDGSAFYEFDNYKGQTCKADMDRVFPILSEVYGVDLSDERVLWSNPDDALAEAKPITPTNSRTRG